MMRGRPEVRGAVDGEVFRPLLSGASALGLLLFFAGCGGLIIAVAIAGIGYQPVGATAGLLAFGAAGCVMPYFIVWMDCLVVGPELVAQGARRGNPKKKVNRADVAAVVWTSNSRSPFARLVDENGIMLLRLSPFYPKRQAQRIAAVLDVPFNG